MGIPNVIWSFYWQNTIIVEKSLIFICTFCSADLDPGGNKIDSKHTNMMQFSCQMFIADFQMSANLFRISLIFIFLPKK